ncbi:MAG: Twitching mobility protein [Firmicutes bacterium ADurb.Bin153]|nr:MAG: Twitching mobility protein [Firmicutes bacterium ADurb.Bin153]HNZ09273.1 type IV pilus twitching motility protein PilT [Bacillota bacterium]HOH11048.1 type IV pilus twitching motility protein PilT [Bacillota bacterium]
MNLDEILSKGVSIGASDVHFTVGLAPMARQVGNLLPLSDYQRLSPADTKELLLGILNEDQKVKLVSRGEIDLSYSIAGVGRFRVNIYHQRGTIAGAFRTIPTEIRNLDELGIPRVVGTVADKQRGLYLVTGPTGSGKSTTLAAIIDMINSSKACHIITLEDPIEYLHKHNKAMVNQREIGSDSENFANALRAALREDPDVILVGEMRDPETTSIAVTAAETGHLVLATLHTVDTVQTIDRIIDQFPAAQQGQIRIQLAGVLIGVMSQQLMPNKDNSGRVVAVEVMMATPAARNLIREGKTHQIYSVIQTGAKYGMQSMDSSLRDLFLTRKISKEEAISRAIDPEELRRMIGG